MTAQIMDGAAVAASLLDATAAGAVDFERRVGRKLVWPRSWSAMIRRATPT